MYFQSTVQRNEYYPQTWAAVQLFNTDVGAIREFLRQGDTINAVSTSDGFNFTSNSTVAAIRSQSAIVVVAISFANDGGYHDITCELGENVHWKVNRVIEVSRTQMF